MKKRFLFLAAVLAIVSCGKDNTPAPAPEPPVDPEPPVEEYGYVNATLPDNSTFTWQAGDELTVIGESTEKYSIVPGFSTRKASFRGKIVSGTSFTVLFGAKESYAKAEAYSYAEQKQAANNDMAHLRPVIAMKSVKNTANITLSKDWAQANGAQFQSSGVIKFTLDLPVGINMVTKLGVKSSRPVFFKTNAASSTTDTLTLTFPNVDVSATNRQLVAYMLAGWQDVNFQEGDKVTITIESDGKNVSKELDVQAGKFEAGSTYEFVTDKKGWKGDVATEGSEANPYEIATAEELVAMKEKLVQDKVDGPVYFILTADVDMKDVAWVPLVTANANFPLDFNGNGHTISNLKVDGNMNFPSFVGVLNGAVHDVIFDKPYINCTKGQADRVAVVTAWAGRNSGDFEAELTNIEVRDASVNVPGSCESPTGILVGQADHATISDCKVSGTVTAAGKVAECNIAGVIGRIDSECKVSNLTSEVDVTIGSASRVIGGCIGSIRQACTVENINHKGTVTVTGNADYSGLMIGHIAGKAVVRNCSVEGTFEGAGNHSGGLVGSIFRTAAGSLVEGCKAKVTMICAAKDVHGILIGSLSQDKTNDVVIRNCDAEGDLTLNGNNSSLGGILGKSNDGTSGNIIEGCSFKGTLSTNENNNGGSIIGGIVGYAQAITVRNCRTEGEITKCNWGIGGICGSVYKDCTIQNCFSKMSLTARHGVGGIAGRADNAANDSNATTSYNDTFEGCIAWNDKVVSRMGIASDNISAGAIVGKSAACNVHKNCWRKADLSFDCYKDAQYNVLFDMVDNDKETALSYSASTANPQVLGSYYWPYHGKAAAAGATASSIAKTIGWDETVWNLSGSEPVLKR